MKTGVRSAKRLLLQELLDRHALVAPPRALRSDHPLAKLNFDPVAEARRPPCGRWRARPAQVPGARRIVGARSSRPCPSNTSPSVRGSKSRAPLSAGAPAAGLRGIRAANGTRQAARVRGARRRWLAAARRDSSAVRTARRLRPSEAAASPSAKRAAGRFMKPLHQRFSRAGPLRPRPAFSAMSSRRAVDVEERTPPGAANRAAWPSPAAAGRRRRCPRARKHALCGLAHARGVDQHPGPAPSG